jgi:hypothetical protein
MKVFIPALPTRFDQATQRRVPSIDLNPAAQYGELVIMSEIGSDLETARKEIIESIKDITEEDYLLSVGDIILVTTACLHANQKLGFVRLLQWSRKNQKYNLTEVSF